MATKSYIIALEEHYYDSEVKRHASGLERPPRRQPCSVSTIWANCA